MKPEFKNCNEYHGDALKTQRDQFRANYESLKKAVESGDKTVTQQMVNDAKKLSDMAEKEYQQSGKNTVAGYVKGLKTESLCEEAAKQMGYDSYSDFNESLGINSPVHKRHMLRRILCTGIHERHGKQRNPQFTKRQKHWHNRQSKV